MENRVAMVVEHVGVEIGAGSPDCRPVQLGLPSGITIPLKGVELADGHYTVSVHGLSASFSVPLVASAPVDETPEPVSGTFCPLVSAPAVALFLPGEGYLITNTLTGASAGPGRGAQR